MNHRPLSGPINGCVSQTTRVHLLQTVSHSDPDFRGVGRPIYVVREGHVSRSEHKNGHAGSLLPAAALPQEIKVRGGRGGVVEAMKDGGRT